MSFVLTTAVWGDSYVDTFLDVCVPTLLAPGNIPSLLAGQSGRYVICTRQRDRGRMLESPSFGRLSKAINVEFLDRREEFFCGNAHRIHGAAWLDVVAKAGRRGEWVALIAPDCFFSDGSIGEIGRRIAAGKKVIFGFSLRVIEHTFLGALGQLIDRNREVWAVAPRQLMRFAFEHLSPLSLCYLRDTRRFGHWPELRLFPVADEGAVLRVFGHHCAAIDPAGVELHESITPLTVANPADVDFITDSDDYALVSVTAISQQLNWFVQPRRYDPVTAALMWDYFDTPLNHELTRRNFLFHHAEITPSKWKPVIARADNHVMLALLTKKFIWAVKVLVQAQGMQVAAELIAWSLIQQRLHKACATRGKISILAPTDAAFARGEPDLVGRLLAAPRLSLAAILRDHCVAGEIGDSVDQGWADSLSGRRLSATRDDGGLRIAGHSIRLLAVDDADGRNVHLYACDALLGELR